jgi:rubrerythrin
MVNKPKTATPKIFAHIFQKKQEQAALDAKNENLPIKQSSYCNICKNLGYVWNRKTNDTKTCPACLKKRGEEQHG